MGIARTDTIGSRLDSHRGMAPGFDFLRLLLAVSVVAYHAPAITLGGGEKTYSPVFDTWHYFVLASFFSLSGFLISASAMRLDLRNFLTNRGLRILPALGVEVILCAVVLGALMTTLSPGEYFSSPETWSYFSNMVGWINWTLPGVFKDHPTDIVNNSLWTVPHEIFCYAIISVFILVGALKRPLWIVGAIALYVAIGLGVSLAGIEIETAETTPDKVLSRLFNSDACRLYIPFMAGILAYLWRHRIPYRPWAFAVCALILLATFVFRLEQVLPRAVLAALLAGPIAYITAMIGSTSIWIPNFLKRGDYSYGIYLYGWPIQQTVYHFTRDVTNPWIQFLMCIVPIALFAAFSWHAIEKPILGLRKKFSFVARVRLDEETTTAAPAARMTDTPAQPPIAAGKTG